MPPMQKGKKDWQTGLIGVGKGCYGYIQTGGLNISNAGLVVGTGSCLVIDTLYVKPMAQTFQRAIRRVTKKPIAQIKGHRALVDIGRVTMGEFLQVLGIFGIDVPVVGKI